MFTSSNQIFDNVHDVFVTNDKNTSFESLHGTFTSSVRWPYLFPKLFDDCKKFSIFALWSLSSIRALQVREII